MMSSRKAICTGSRIKGQRNSTAHSESPAMGTWIAKMYAIAFFRLSKIRRPSRTALNDGREIIIQQNKVRGFAGNIGSPLAHGNANMRGFQRRGVVHSVASHRDDLAVGLQGIDQLKLLLGHSAGKDAGPRDAVAERPFIHRRDFRTRDGSSDAFESDLARDAHRGAGIIAGDHDDPDSRCLAFLNCTGNGRPDRIGQER